MLLGFRCYHCGNKDTITRFCEDSSFMPISKHLYDRQWAGPGMYLWDNLSNAKSWYNSRNDKEQRRICKCYLRIDEDNLLDMTDFETAESMQEFIKMMEQTEEVSTTDEVGTKIAFIAKTLNSQAIKLFGNYPHFKQNPFFEGYNKEKAHADITAKVIYCVREGNPDILIERELEEVI